MSFSLRPGHVPLLVSMPHVGTEIPMDLRARYVPRALAVEARPPMRGVRRHQPEIRGAIGEAGHTGLLVDDAILEIAEQRLPERQRGRGVADIDLNVVDARLHGPVGPPSPTSTNGAQK